MMINSPSWQSVLLYDKESTSTVPMANQTPLTNPSLEAYLVTSPVNPPVPTRLSVTQLSNPSTPWGTSAQPPALSNPADSVTQVTQPMSVNQATVTPPPKQNNTQYSFPTLFYTIFITKYVPLPFSKTIHTYRLIIHSHTHYLDGALRFIGR